MRNKLIIKYLIFLVLFLIVFPLFAQQQTRQWWLTLEQGKQRFRSGDYGASLLLFEDARRQRRGMYEQMERDLIQLLSRNPVRRLNDSLDRIEHYANAHFYIDAAAALAEIFFRFPRDSFNNSAAAALGVFEKLKNYPEAEYWIGEVYRVEGELTLALNQYRRAYEMRAVLEDPGFSVTLLYKIANVHRTRQEFTEMERILLSIINENDAIWTGRASSLGQGVNTFIRNAMTTTLRDPNHGINRFLEYFRHDNAAVEQAHRLIGYYFIMQRRPSAETHLMFAFLIQNTIIIEEIRRNEFDFRFTNFTALARRINNNELLLRYVDEVEYYKTIYYLAASLFLNTHGPIARELWTFLASQPQAGEWQRRAANQLRNPRLEPLVEMP